MSGKMLAAFASDFDFMLDDWGKSILVKHLVGESISPSTGEKIKVETETYIMAVLERLTKKDMDLYPSFFTENDRKAYYKEHDATIEKGDTIEVDSISYIVHDIESIDGVNSMRLKRI